MKKKLLTIFVALALVVAMVITVVACGPTPTPTPTPGPDVVTPPDDDFIQQQAEIAEEGFGVLTTGLGNVLDNALGESQEKSYDLTLFVKVKVGDSVDADVKLRVAGTFGAENKGLVDVIVGGQSYVTLYAEDNTVYVGEALTQEAMNWFKIDAVKDAKMMDKFFPQLLDFMPPTISKDGQDKPIHEVIKGFFSLVPMVGNLISATEVKGGIVKNDLGGGEVEYVNTLALGNLGKVLEDLKSLFDVRTLLNKPEIQPYKGLIDTVCNVIFGGSLDALLDGEIAPEDAPTIVLSFRSKDDSLTKLGISYENDIAFDDAQNAKKTNISVAFGLEDVKITTNANTAIATSAITAGVKAAKEPAIKLTIGAEIPEKDLGATIDAYVIPDVSLVVNRYAIVDGQRVKIESETHEGHTADCKHFYNVDTVNMGGAKAYAVATNKNGDAVNLACDADVSEMADGTIVLRFDLAGVYTILGIENTGDLPTKFQKTFKLWGDDEAEESEGNESETETETETEADQGDEEEPTNLIDKVVAIFGNGFEIGKVVDLLGDGIDFLKDIYAAVLQPNMASDETTKVATLNVANILKGLVANETIQGSNRLKINGEKNLTEYLSSLQGIADLVDNIKRHSVKVEAGQTPPAARSKYTKAELVQLVKDYAGIDITDEVFNNTTLELKGIRGNATKDEGLGFEATLKSEGKTVLVLTMKADVVDAATVPAQDKIDYEDFTADNELDGGEASDNILTLLEAIHNAYKNAQKAA